MAFDAELIKLIKNLHASPRAWQTSAEEHAYWTGNLTWPDVDRLFPDAGPKADAQIPHIVHAPLMWLRTHGGVVHKLSLFAYALPTPERRAQLIEYSVRNHVAVCRKHGSVVTDNTVERYRRQCQRLAYTLTSRWQPEVGLWIRYTCGVSSHPRRKVDYEVL